MTLSMESTYLLIIGIAAITFVFRALPFLFHYLLADKQTIQDIQYYLPASIMILLILYNLKDVRWLVPPYGSAECIAIVAVVMMHCWLRNALISIVVGTGIYVFAINVILGSY